MMRMAAKFFGLMVPVLSSADRKVIFAKVETYAGVKERQGKKYFENLKQNGKLRGNTISWEIQIKDGCDSNGVPDDSQ